MNYNDFLTRQQQIKKLSIAEQKNFYEQLLKKKYDKTEVRILASFYYGQLFYQEGNFRKTIEIIEPIIVDYQSYPYTPKLLSCFNLIGVATHCETEYNVSRFFYETALKIAMENDEKYYYAFEYNNIALTYIEEQNYEEALKSLALAEDVLKDCDAAVVALRPPSGQESDLARLTTGVLDAASRSRTPLLIIGGAAPLTSPTHPGTLAIDDPAIVPPEWRDVARASLDQIRACQTHSYRGWVYLSPPAIFGPGDISGSYRRGTTTLLVDSQGQSRISPEDLALAVVDELEQSGGQQHFTVIASV